MATIEETITYRCSDDCEPGGCPSHKGTLIYQSCSDAYTFMLDGKKTHYKRGELEAMLALLRQLNRGDAVQVN